MCQALGSVCWWTPSFNPEELREVGAFIVPILQMTKLMDQLVDGSLVVKYVTSEPPAWSYSRHVPFSSRVFYCDGKKSPKVCAVH